MGLLTLRDNLLTLSQVEISFNSSLNVSCNTVRSFPLFNRFVSLANRIGIVCLQIFANSLMYKSNKRGPTRDPCCTPHLVVLHDDFTPFKVTYCCLVVNNFQTMPMPIL